MNSKWIAASLLTALLILSGCAGNSTPNQQSASPTPSTQHGNLQQKRSVEPPPTTPAKTPNQNTAGAGFQAGKGQLAVQPAHVVVVVEENHAASQIIGNASAPYINSLAAQGALFTNSHGVEHPSEPNYLDLFSGSNQGVTDDSCPHHLSAPNLGSGLLAVGKTFGGYSENLPQTGFSGCSSNGYARKHNPWVNFTNLPATVNMPLSSFPSDYSKLPTVSFVIPTLDDDMHDGAPAQADAWLQNHVDTYVKWAQGHNSLLIVTFDEDNNTKANLIPTLFVGPVVKQGRYNEQINHFNVLRTLEDMYGLPYAGQSANVAAIKDVWKS